MLKHAILACITAFAAVTATTVVPVSALAEPAQPQAREIEITVESGNYKPARVMVQEGEKVRLKFVRKEYNGCTKDVVFPGLNIKRELPPNKPVYVDLPELKAGEVPFHCGMNMAKGSVVVGPKR